MEVDKLAAGLHRLGDKSVTDLRKCVIIVAGLSADYEMSVGCWKTTQMVLLGLRLSVW